MDKINSLVNEFKAINELLEDSNVESSQEAIANANRRINVIRRDLWNLGISPAQLYRLAKA